jgi:hypothetical protein
MRDAMRSDEYEGAVAAEIARQAAEDAVIEQAPWFGTTGLPDEVERRVPRYVRLEFGESLANAGALRAADIEYVGAFIEAEGRVHYWRIPASAVPDPLYVYYVEGPGGLMALGGRAPPPK